MWIWENFQRICRWIWQNKNKCW